MRHKTLLLQIMRRIHKKRPPASDRTLFTILCAGAIGVFLLLAYHVWNNYASRSIASLLPAENLSGYVELEDRYMPFRFSDGAKDVSVGEAALRIFGISQDAIPGWAKKNVGLAVINEKPVLFFRSATRRQALGYLKKLTLANEKLENRGSDEYPVYIYPQSQNFAFSFAGPYLFISKDALTLATIYGVLKNEIPSLEKSPDYAKAFLHLPKNPWMRGYADLNRLKIPEVTDSPFFAPLRTIASKISWTVRKKQGGFHFNTFLNINPEFKKEAGPAKESLFAYGLSEVIHAEDLGLYLGGMDLSLEWRHTLKTLNHLNPAYGILLEGMLRAQVGRIFGPDVSLEEDLYPLFENEYALNLSWDGNKPALQLILAHKDRKQTEEKMEKLAKGFGLLSAQFSPRIKETPLPDGALNREVVTETDHLKDLRETQVNYQIDCREIKMSLYGFCYATSDSLLIMSSNLSGLKNTINAQLGKATPLSQYNPFRKGLSDLSKVSDEITFVNLRNLFSIVGKSPLAILAEPYLKPFDTVTWVKHRFEDGVSTEGFLLLR